MNGEINENIKCTVHQCKYHANTQNYCVLDCIQVGSHETDPKVIQCTDCNSFELK